MNFSEAAYVYNYTCYALSINGRAIWNEAGVVVVRGGAVEGLEFARFVLTGVVATVGNISAVWLSRHILPYEMALLVGIMAGLIISFSMSKLYAFRSHSWERASGELARFLGVYAFGAAIYWLVAMYMGHIFLPNVLRPRPAEMAGALLGASTMAITSYFGHRFFTYRTFQRRDNAEK